MRKAPAATAGLALLFAFAASGTAWSDFGSAFPLSPCQDGWAACRVANTVITPDMPRDGDGMPVPADQRVGWFDLDATASFSPFPALSVYTGELPQVEAPAQEPVEDDPPPVQQVAHNSEPRQADPIERDDPPPQAVRPTEPRAVEAAPEPASTAPVTRASDPAPSVRPSSSVRPKADPAVADVAPAEPVSSNAILSAPKASPAAADNSCDNIRKLEPMAMLGKLSKGQTQCLEASLQASAKQTEKDKISRVLLTNAYSARDIRTWEKLIRRHLDEIDRSDPDLCYKYALHLSKKGSSRADGAIRWAETALENRSLWTGSTYVSRVNSLYKIRAASAQKKWQAAEKSHASSPTDKTKKFRDSWRAKTKVMAREWYEYAKEAGKDTTLALQLCVSAAGTEDYCRSGG